MAKARADKTTSHRRVFEKNKQRILKSQDTCGICGRPVDKSIPWPHPMSACIDHIIPIDKGGHPSDMSNLQLAHMCCNRQKSNKLREPIKIESQTETISNRVLPQSTDWTAYRS